MSQRELGEALGLDASAVSRLEQGARSIRLNEAAAIAEKLNVGLDSLTFGDDPEVVFEELLGNFLRLADSSRDGAKRLANSFLSVVQMVDCDPKLLQKTIFRNPDAFAESADEYAECLVSHFESTAQWDASDAIKVDDTRAEQLRRLIAAVTYRDLVANHESKT